MIPNGPSLALLALLAASPATADLPPTDGIPAIRARVLALVNEARSVARRCGWKRLAAVPPLAQSEALDRAALAHARDMAARSRMQHAGGDGSAPGDRATRAGYRWRTVGENVAAGQATPEEAVAAWLKSSKHCANLMDPDYVEMGVGFSADPQGAGGPYWVQVFGAPAP